MCRCCCRRRKSRIPLAFFLQAMSVVNDSTRSRIHCSLWPSLSTRLASSARSTGGRSTMLTNRSYRNRRRPARCLLILHRLHCVLGCLRSPASPPFAMETSSILHRSARVIKSEWLELRRPCVWSRGERAVPHTQSCSRNPGRQISYTTYHIYSTTRLSCQTRFLCRCRQGIFETIEAKRRSR